MVLQRKRDVLMLFAGVITLIGLILIVDIVLITKAKREKCDEAVAGQSGGAKTDRCSYSEEAKRAGVDIFLQKVQDTYFDLHPQDLVYNPGGVEPSVLRAKFKPYNPDPKSLKRVTDSARNLLDELDGFGVNTRRLKPREKKAIV